MHWLNLCQRLFHQIRLTWNFHCTSRYSFNNIIYIETQDSCCVFCCNFSIFRHSCTAPLIRKLDISYMQNSSDNWKDVHPFILCHTNFLHGIFSPYEISFIIELWVLQTLAKKLCLAAIQVIIILWCSQLQCGAQLGRRASAETIENVIISFIFRLSDNPWSF